MDGSPTFRARLFKILTGAWPWELFWWTQRMTERHRILLFSLGGGFCLLMGYALWQLVDFYQSLPAGVAMYTNKDFPKWWVLSLLVGNLVSTGALSITGILLYGLGHHTTWTRRLGLSTMAVAVVLLFVLVILAYALAPEFIQSERMTH